MREISNLDLKIQFLNEYLRTGGVQKIFDRELLQDIINVEFDRNGKANPSTITPRLNAFMLALLASHSHAPFTSKRHMSEYSSFIQKSIYFDQIKIETKEEVDQLFEDLRDNKDFLFRGQREAKWRLYSSLQRFWVWDNMETTDLAYGNFLKLLVENGRNKYQAEIQRILEDINIDATNDIAVLGYLQHHNCPTPLMDWTFSFEIAMFFGVDGIDETESPVEINNYFSLYYIREVDFSDGGMRNLMQMTLKDAGDKLKLELIGHIASNDDQRIEMEKHFSGRELFDSSKIKGSGLVSHMTKIENMMRTPLTYFSDDDIDTDIAFSITNSENIKKQNGVFTWNSDFSKPIEIVGNEQYNESKLEGELNDYRFCECYNINKNLAKYIVGKLKALGISSETVYPDKDIDTKDIYVETKQPRMGIGISI